VQGRADLKHSTVDMGSPDTKYETEVDGSDIVTNATRKTEIHFQSVIDAPDRVRQNIQLCSKDAPLNSGKVSRAHTTACKCPKDGPDALIVLKEERVCNANNFNVIQQLTVL
jgi:hypothetical protein